MLALRNRFQRIGFVLVPDQDPHPTVLASVDQRHLDRVGDLDLDGPVRLGFDLLVRFQGADVPVGRAPSPAAD